MPLNATLLDLGSAITDIFSFLVPADQHKLRRSSSGMCEWFDSAAENGSLAFFVTFTPDNEPTGFVRWKHATGDPYMGAVCKQRSCYNVGQATVTIQLNNYCLSTYNKVSSQTAVAKDTFIDNAVIRLMDDFPFEHKLVITGLFDIRSISNGFCRGVHAREIEFKGSAAQLRSVGDYWMQDCPNLRSVTFVGFTALEKVGNLWMSDCNKLENILFADGMPTLKKVQSSWMTDCPRVKNISFSGFDALEEVGDYWLCSCLELKSVTFNGGLAELRRVGDEWMSKCQNLTSVTFEGFTALEEVGNHWLSRCSSLQIAAYGGGLPKLRTVRGDWMSCCSQLKQIEFSEFSALEEVGENWMSKCRSLQTVTFADVMPRLRLVKYDWLSNCSNLKSVTCSGFPALEEVDYNWLYECPSLESLKFSYELPKLWKVGYNWLCKCPKLKYIDFSTFIALKEVGRTLFDNYSLSDHRKVLKLS